MVPGTLVLLAGGALVSLPGAATEPAEGADSRPPPVSPEAPSRPAVGLDQLLRLPSDVRYDVDRYGGATRSEWRARFRKATDERDTRKRDLEKSQEQLAEMAAQTDGWNLGAPGTAATSDPDTPLNFQLKQRIRRQEKELAEAEEALRSLQVEANLARVPEDWRAVGPEPREASEISFEP